MSSPPHPYGREIVFWLRNRSYLVLWRRCSKRLSSKAVLRKAFVQPWQHSMRSSGRCSTRWLWLSIVSNQLMAYG